MSRNKRKPNESHLWKRRASACVGGAVVGLLAASPGSVAAQDASRLEKLEQENQALRQRLDTLETAAKKEGFLPSGEAPKSYHIKALTELNISGYVQASYFYNTENPDDGYSDGYLWNTKHNSFSINKVKLTLASPPVERSGDAFDAGYRVSMIWGEDAPVLNTGGENQGLEALREAYVELNLPIGTGLNFKLGQLISLLNWESGDGGAANPNFSQGYQWFYTGNGPSAGAQLGYTFTDWLDLKVRVQNGIYAGAIDSNDGKAVMASIGIKPGSKTWFNLIGFASEETTTLDVAGASVIGGHTFTDQFGVGFEFDYFNFDSGATDADLWSMGGWAWYDFTSKIGLAFRAEYIGDPDGGGLKGINLPNRPNSAITSADPDGDIASFTLTLNLKPVDHIKIQPEIRYDTTAYEGGYDGEESRVTIGAGVSYIF